MLKAHDTTGKLAAQTQAVAAERSPFAAVGGLEAGRIRRWALRLVPLVLLAIAALVLWREIRDLSFAEVGQAMVAWGPGHIVAALALSTFSFVLMGLVEGLGLRWAGARAPWKSVLGVSFLSNGIAHSVGANLLVSGALRARLYQRYGVSLAQVAQTTLFGGMAFAAGIGVWEAAVWPLSPATQIAATAIPPGLARVLGWSLIAAVASYVVLCAFRRSPVHAFGRSLTPPSVGSALAQIGIGVVDNGVAAGIIWLLLPAGDVPYQTFVGAYAVATVAGLLSSVPAGAGVFEGAVFALLPSADGAPLAAAFLGYRLVYYLLPLLVACLALAAHTMQARGR